MQVDVLALAPHPDDIETTCSGTIVKMLSQGYKVAICDLTQGEMGSRGSKEIRKEELTEAAKIMGLTARVNLKIPDGWVENTKENKFKVIEVIRKFRPKIVIAPYWVDRHPDHQTTGQLVEQATFMAGLKNIKTESEPYRPKRVLYAMFRTEFQPSFIVDISETFKTKMKAIQAYKSQFFVPGAKTSNEPVSYISTPAFMELLESRSRYYGSLIGRKYGEPFLIREVLELNDPVSFFDGIANEGLIYTRTF
ncbi:MAG: bacillithiol biosynthesis deacetylase BshB1 [Calditrichaeota bacterium]|nr:MAG: bacillithiol biosynthesis deacetylase BshB1 [Calditrichota bacterium]